MDKSTAKSSDQCEAAKTAICACGRIGMRIAIGRRSIEEGGMKTGGLKKSDHVETGKGASTTNGASKIVRTVKPAPKRGSLSLATVRRAVAEVIAARKK
jgi:hypothetical protein